MEGALLYLAQRRQNHRTQAQPNDEHAQTQRRDGRIASKLLHHLRVGAGVERARARDAQARAGNDEHDDPFAQRGQALGAPRVLVAAELDLEAGPCRLLLALLQQRLFDIAWAGKRRGNGILFEWRGASGSVGRLGLGCTIAYQCGRRGVAGHGFCGWSAVCWMSRQEEGFGEEKAAVATCCVVNIVTTRVNAKVIRNEYLVLEEERKEKQGAAQTESM